LRPNYIEPFPVVDAGAYAIVLACALANANVFVTANRRTALVELTLSLSFAKGYIAHPYWPELEKVINIDKESGVRRVRSEAARTAALSEYLTKHGMTVDELEALRARAERQFDTAADVERMSFGEYALNGHDPDEICIPPNQIYGCLAQSSDLARSATRVASRDQIRSVLGVREPIYTGKTEPDGVFERFAVVTSGTGAKFSNQRACAATPTSAPLPVTWCSSSTAPRPSRRRSRTLSPMPAARSA
jgi:hypothetical protein